MRESVFTFVSKVERAEKLATIYLEGSRTKTLLIDADKAPESGLVYLLVKHDDDWLLAQETYCYYHKGAENTMPLLHKEPFLLRAMWGYAQCLLSHTTKVDELKHQGSLENINAVLKVCQNIFILKRILATEELREMIVKRLFGLSNDIAVRIALALLIDKRDGFQLEHRGDVGDAQTISVPEHYI